MKLRDEALNVIKNHIRRTHEEEGEGKRLEWGSLGVVSKFVAVPVYETDWIGLNELLQDLGILPYVSSIDMKALTDEQKSILEEAGVLQKNGAYVKYNPNKLGRVSVDHIVEEYDWLTESEPLQQIETWKHLKSSFDRLDQTYRNNRDRALLSGNWNGGSVRKISFEYGSFSLVDKELQVKPEDVVQILGTEVLIKSAKTDLSEIDTYCAMGFLNKKDLEPYRKVRDISLRHLVMELEQEASMMQFFQRRISRLALIGQSA